MIEIKNISKKYKNGVLANDDITLTIEKGDIVGVLGPNGAGKTTLIRQMVGLLKPTSGDIQYNDRYNIYKDKNKIAKLISFFNQKTVLLEAHTAYEVIYFTGIYRNLSKAESKKQTESIMDYFNIRRIEKRKMSTLSGGQTKLIVLASAFIGKFPIIILDEPTNDLDPKNRSLLWNYILNYNQQYKTTFIIVSHNINELETVVKNVAIIQSGKLKAYEGIIELKNKYSTGYNISIQCEMDVVQQLLDELPHKNYKRVNNEVIYNIEDEHFHETMKEITPLITKYSAEIKVYKNTLSNIYNLMEEK